MEVGLSGVIISKLVKEYSLILDFIFQIDVDNMETYSECICMLLRLNIQSDQMGELSKIILNRIISFKERVNQALLIKDEEEIKFFIDIFFTLCEANLSSLIAEKNEEIFLILLNLTKNSPQERIAVICDFWHRFNINLFDIQDKNILGIYGRIIKDSTLYILNLAKFEENLFIQLNQKRTKEINKTISNYKKIISGREIIKENLYDLSHIISFQILYDDIIKPLADENIFLIKQDITNVSAWTNLELALFGFESIAKNISSDLNNTKSLINIFFEIPDDLIQIKRTITNILDELGSVLSTDTEILIKSFNFLLCGLDNPLLKSKIIFNQLTQNIAQLH